RDMKALIRSPHFRRLAEPRDQAQRRMLRPLPPPSPLADPLGHRIVAAAGHEPKWKRAGKRLIHQGLRAGEATTIAAVFGYAYGRFGDPDGKSALSKVPFDLAAGVGFELAASLTENDYAASHLEALALGALSLHA